MSQAVRSRSVFWSRAARDLSARPSFAALSAIHASRVRPRQADLRGKSRPSIRSLENPRNYRSRTRHLRRGGDRRRLPPVPARCRDASGRREPCRSLDRGTGRPSSRPISSAPMRCLTPRFGYWRNLAGRRATSFRFHHISTDEVFGSLGPEGLFREDSPMSRTRPIPRQRPDRIIWCAPGTTPTDCRRSPPIARTITGPTTFPKS